MRRTLAAVVLLALATAAGAAVPVEVQVPDATYAPRVVNPAFVNRHPTVMVDEAHRNYFTVSGFYSGLAALLRADGLQVVAGTQRFTPAALRGCQVLVVADACGADTPEGARARTSAFWASECDAVRDWVKQGGSLLLVADSAPYGSAMDSLGRRFGVDMGKSYTVDTRRGDPEMKNLGCILFQRQLDMLGDHAILRGRNPAEQVDRVATFSGQSLAGPPGSKGLLRLGNSAWDVPFTPDSRTGDDPRLLARMDTTSVPETPGSIPALGRFQAMAFTLGRGRVVVLGDGAMLSAQLLRGREALRRGKHELRIGLNRTDLDNERFALNVVRWLGRALD
jgi:hypothetical protein